VRPVDFIANSSPTDYDDAVMLTRRNFLELSAAALPMFARPLWAQTHFPIGLQLSTLSKMAKADLPGTLSQIHSVGYQEVELTPVAYTLPVDQLRKAVADSGLKAPSGHFEYTDLSGQFDYAKALGLTWVVCPMLPKSQWTSADGFHTAARQFNEWGKRAHDMKMRFAFHNHDYEFRQFDGTTGYDILLKETDPKLVFLELDCYWITQAGLDPVDMLNRLGKRVRMLHIKDRKPGFPSSNDMSASSAHFTEVGTGGIDWPHILAVARKLQVEHYFVEQDHIDGPPIDSIRASYTYLRKIFPA
jgi:sugar phosphate isomerase/epimerase